MHQLKVLGTQVGHQMSDGVNPLGLRKEDLTSVYIDGPNFHVSVKAIDPEFKVDYIKLRDLFDNNCRLQGLYYYAVLSQETYNTVGKLIDFIGNNGYRTKGKEERRTTTEHGTRVRGSMNVDITVDAIRAANHGMIHLVFFMSSADMVPLIEEVKKSECRVTVVSTTHNNIVSDHLRWVADSFVDLREILDLIRLERYDND